MPQLGPWELIIILLIVVVIFGAGRLSEIGGALGRGIREFRSATTEEEAAAAAAASASASGATPIQETTASAGAPTTPPVAVATEHKCPSCGTINQASQAFCGQCGAKITKAA